MAQIGQMMAKSSFSFDSVKKSSKTLRISRKMTTFAAVSYKSIRGFGYLEYNFLMKVVDS